MNTGGNLFETPACEAILKEFTLEEVLEMCDITPEEVLEILVERGLIVLPPFFQQEEQQ